MPASLNEEQKPILTLNELVAMYDFSGKTAVITGGSGILGSEFACALAGCGANVAILDINVEPGKAVLKRLGERAARAALFECDVLDVKSLEKASAEVIARFGRIDCLINAAGGNKPQATASADLKFFDIPADALRWVFELNLLGTVLPCQVFGRMMAQQDGGTILNISSLAALRPLTGWWPTRREKRGSATLPSGWRFIWRRSTRRAFASTP